MDDYDRAKWTVRLLSLALSQVAVGKGEGFTRWAEAEKRRQQVRGRWPWEPGRGGPDHRHAWLEAELEQGRKGRP
jgi:hypothetical protein